MSTGCERPQTVEAEAVARGELVARPRHARPPHPAVVDGVIEGQVVRVIEIERYPQASTGLGGCTAFTGSYVTDPTEIAAIARRVGGGR